MDRFIVQNSKGSIVHIVLCTKCTFIFPTYLVVTIVVNMYAGHKPVHSSVYMTAYVAGECSYTCNLSVLCIDYVLGFEASLLMNCVVYEPPTT